MPGRKPKSGSHNHNGNTPTATTLPAVDTNSPEASKGHKRPSQQQQQKRRRRKRRPISLTSGKTAVPANFSTLTGALFLTGLLGTCMNIAYVSLQTALKWERETTTADFTAQQDAAHEFPLAQGSHRREPPLAGPSHEAQTPHRPPQASHSRPYTNISDPSDPYFDKEPLLQLLEEARMTPIDNDTAAALPTWTQISQLYGSQPVYYGLDNCARFQRTGLAASHFLGIAGTFNSGTNLLAELLLANCHMPARMAQYGPRQRGIRWQVVWGKHTPVGNETFRQLHRTYTDVADLTADDVFAAVMIRDPYRWMQSMCHHPYAATWGHADSHCPSLVPNNADRLEAPRLQDLDHIPVSVEYSNFTRHHESLVHFWNDWYQEYLHAKFPYLLVRFEDLIYHPQPVVQTVCECAGGEMNGGSFQYITGSAKKGAAAHGAESERTGYLQALSRYGKPDGRTTGMEMADLMYARQYLNAELMQTFRYRYHDEGA